MEGDIGRRIGAAGAVLHPLYGTVVAKREPSRTAKLPIYRSILPSPMRLCEIVGTGGQNVFSQEGGWCLRVIREELCLERSQLRWFIW